MINVIIIGIFVVILIRLILENKKNIENRKKLKAIIHVNGIRGKSTVTRLIDAGLKSGGFNTYAKTTGTLPMTINTQNKEELIIRKSRANIKEQIKIIKDAVDDGAEILTIECMAVNPRNQYVSQNSILDAKIGVLTNVRLDHTEEMGYSLEEICESLGNFIPYNGVLITSEEKFFDKLVEICKSKNTKIIKTNPKDEYELINFKENVACAVEVCKLFGIDENTSLKGMKNFIRDPYDLRIYQLKNKTLFINGLSINDPDSSELVFNKLSKELNFEYKKLILLINNRPDRGYRANHMVDLAKRLNPEKVIIFGSFNKIIAKKLSQYNPIILNNTEDLDFDMFSQDEVIFAVGNIANNGDKILEKVRMEGEEYV